MTETSSSRKKTKPAWKRERETDRIPHLCAPLPLPGTILSPEGFYFLSWRVIDPFPFQGTLVPSPIRPGGFLGQIGPRSLFLPAPDHQRGLHSGGFSFVSLFFLSFSSFCVVRPQGFGLSITPVTKGAGICPEHDILCQWKSTRVVHQSMAMDEDGAAADHFWSCAQASFAPWVRCCEVYD